MTFDALYDQIADLVHQHSALLRTRQAGRGAWPDYPDQARLVVTPLLLLRDG